MIWLLDNPIMEYPWGSKTAIPDLLGRRSPSEKPNAELWMGAHPKAPSLVCTENGKVSLIELIADNPQKLLGSEISDRFSGKLPFLFKVLAAAEPLSIQAHPNLRQAREGWHREQRLKIALNAANRSYRDDNHKPEIICALSKFRALKGFRTGARILKFLEDLSCPSLKCETDILRKNPNPTGVRNFFKSLINMERQRKRVVIRECITSLQGIPVKTIEQEWILKLHSFYPEDTGILSPIMLNLIELEPGEALALKAGELHAYLEGVGIELMANSDNVLRGGLTSKHIDVPELLKILIFEPSAIEIIKPRKKALGERVYDAPFEEFQLTSLELRKKPFRSRTQRSLEIWITIGGEAEIIPEATPVDDDRRNGNQSLSVRQGQSFVIASGLPRYRIEGQAFLFRATVPL